MEQKLLHLDGEAERFQLEFHIDLESQWFIEFDEGLGHGVSVGDSAQMRASFAP